MQSGCLTERMISAKNYHTFRNPKNKCEGLYITSANSACTCAHGYESNIHICIKYFFVDSIIHMVTIITYRLSQEMFFLVLLGRTRLQGKEEVWGSLQKTSGEMNE